MRKVLNLSVTCVNEKVFLEIQKQTGYGFAYKTEILKKGKAVDIDVKQASLEDVLAICLKDQPLSYTIVDRVIVISKKEENIVGIKEMKITGKTDACWRRLRCCNETCC